MSGSAWGAATLALSLYRKCLTIKKDDYIHVEDWEAAERFRPSGANDDPSDARPLLDTLTLRGLNANTPETRTLQFLVEERRFTSVPPFHRLLHVGPRILRKARAEGKRNNSAIRALAFKRIPILFRCWKECKPYDEAIYQRAYCPPPEEATRRSSFVELRWKNVAGLSKTAIKEA